MASVKIRIGGRVRHKRKPELGYGTVWELRAARVSVQWDGLEDRRHHYQYASIEAVSGAAVAVVPIDWAKRGDRGAKV